MVHEAEANPESVTKALAELASDALPDEVELCDGIAEALEDTETLGERDPDIEELSVTLTDTDTEPVVLTLSDTELLALAEKLEVIDEKPVGVSEEVELVELDGEPE